MIQHELKVHGIGQFSVVIGSPCWSLVTDRYAVSWKILLRQTTLLTSARIFRVKPLRGNKKKNPYGKIGA
ncbi:MAG: hypothetical protein IJY22_02700, partial [Clostridia bacterium]|nr:hypothetical protein [Clostridia bacterium]